MRTLANIMEGQGPGLGLTRQARMTLNNAPQQVSVIVNSVPKNDTSAVRSSRGVTVTPLSILSPRANQKVVCKILLKAVGKHGRKRSKTFTLRNISVSEIYTCSLLKELIRAQLREDITTSGFDVGFLNGSNVVSIRNKDDLADIWSNLLRGERIILWCDGLAGSQKCKSAESDSDDSNIISKPKKKARDREDRVQEVHNDLKKEHGDKFTTMQYCIWSEMVAGGMHGSTVEPPATSMFLRAGGTNQKKANVSESVSQAMTQIASALTPSTGNRVSGGSPARVIDNRSKCYKQLAELRNLMESGLLSEDEYASERAAIMATLKNLCR